MQNNIKRYICFLVFFIGISSVIFALVVDNTSIKNKYDLKVDKNQYLKKIDSKSNPIEIENLYIMKITKKDVVTKQAQEKKIDTKKVSEIGKINIFSTNKWRIKIPKINVDAPITEGTSQEALKRTVGHFEITDKWKGNVALAGHNRGYRCNFFQEIKKLNKGDLIIYSTEKGERKYKVVLNKVIKETDWSYIKNTKDNRLTLITCETNKREYRRCIQAIEIKNR